MSFFVAWLKRGGTFLNKPATPEEISACKELVGHLPPPLCRILVESNGSIVGATCEPDLSGLHILPTERIAEMTATFRGTYGEHFSDLVVWAKTPGAGAFYLAMTQDGRIVDLFGQPYSNPIAPDPRFEPYMGEWQVIAQNPTDLLTRMLEARPDQPMYWFERP